LILFFLTPPHTRITVVKTRLLIAVCFLFVPTYGRADSLGERIVAFCRENKDKAVGDGDCYDLAKFALHAAGAKPQFKNPDFPNKSDYVWGDLVVVIEGDEAGSKKTGKLKEIRPGDVIQFRDTKWSGPKSAGKGTYSLTFKHHTAIVAAVENDGKLIKIYHQNYQSKKYVMEGSLKPDDLKSGWARIYRPLPK
jgi:hypothetical protein